MELSGRMVLDASTFVELVGEFHYPQAARAFLEAYATPETEVEVWTLDLAYPEAASALRGLVLGRHLEAAEAKRGLELIVGLPVDVAATSAVVLEAWEARDRMSVYDACYVTLARRLGGRLVTADARLARGARQFKDPVVLLEEL